MPHDACDHTAAYVELTRGDFAILYAADLHRVSHVRWRSHSCGYARGDLYPGGRRRAVYMHALLTNAPETDHIDHNRLNNRLDNLRPATAHDNGGNLLKRRGGTSRFKGVCWSRAKGRWRAYITHHYRNIELGHFDSEEDAARAYDQAARVYFRAFARPNFPGPGEHPAL